LKPPEFVPDYVVI